MYVLRQTFAQMFRSFTKTSKAPEHQSRQDVNHNWLAQACNLFTHSSTRCCAAKTEADVLDACFMVQPKPAVLAPRLWFNGCRHDLKHVILHTLKERFSISIYNV